jgi:ATP-binding protein involved in chromosome partitioning
MSEGPVLTVADINSRLEKVIDPILERSLPELGAIRELAVDGGQISMKVVLTSPAHPARDHFEAEIREQLGTLGGVESVEIQMESEIPSDGRSRQLEAPVHNAIAVGSGKGGVGKTTIAVNLAVSLARAGASVGLLDADVYGPNVPTMLGVDRLPPPTGEKMIPATAYGVKVISIAFLVKPGQPLIWRGPMLHSAIRQFITDVDWGELDYLIIDLPPGTGDAALSLTQSLPLSGAVIVTLPQAVSLEDASRGLEMFRSMEVPVLGVVENMSFLELEDGQRIDVFGMGGGIRLADESGVPFLGSIPMDPEVRRAGDSGVPVVVSHPDSNVAAALVEFSGRASVLVSRFVLDPGSQIELEVLD